MSAIESSISMPADIRGALVARMSHFRRQVRSRMLLEGFARVLAVAVVLALVTFLLDRTFRLTLPVRLAMVAAAIGVLAVAFWQEVLGPLRLKLSPLVLATALDRAAGDASGRFTARVGSVMELPELLRSPNPPSAAMVREAVARCHEAIHSFDPAQRLDNRRKNLAMSVMSASLLLPVLLTLVAPATVRLWAARIFAGSNEPWPQKTYLQVAGLDRGGLVVPRGEPFVLRVNAKSGSVVPEAIALRFREGTGGRVSANFTSFGSNDFRYDFPGINDSVTAEIWGGDDVLPSFVIRPADRPRVVDLRLITQHPMASAPQTYTFSGSDSDLSFLPRTKMRLLFSANTPIAQARLSSSAPQPASADLRQLDAQHFSVEWTQQTAAQLHIELVSRDARLVSVPTDVAIGLKVDQPPRITLGFTGVHQRVSPRARIPLTADGRDDYGVARMVLNSKAERPDPANPGKLVAETKAIDLFGPAGPATELEVQQARTEELEGLNLPPGSLFTVSASATDACYLGPQTTSSRQLTFRVVPASELFREILLRQQAQRAKFRKQTDEARALRERITTLSTPAGASDLAHRHRAIQRESASVTAALMESVVEMRLNALATDEAYALLEKNVIAPLKSLNEDLMNPQKDALDVLNPTDSGTLAQVADRQDKIVAKMEEILKQMSQWDSFVDVLNQLNEIIRLQDMALQTTKHLKSQQTEGVFEH